MIYSDGFMAAIGVMIRAIVVLLILPVLIFVMIYRKLKGKRRLNIGEWILK